MWESSDADGCAYDTTDCMHICKGCIFGVVECTLCKELIDYPDSKCPSCGRSKLSLLFDCE